MTPMIRSTLAVLLLATLTISGCGRSVDGAATRGSLAVDPAFFFAGEVPVYGQTVSNSDRVALAYRRAIRRIDVCGLVNADALGKIGEVVSLATLFAFDECDAEVKVPGRPDRRFVTVQLDMTRADPPAAFRVGGAPVYETSPGSCDFLTPLDLGRLPGAARLHKPDQPFLRVGLIGESDCGLAKKVAGAITGRVTGASLPPRDSAAGYPVALAERDPCEVLSVLAGDVDRWDISSSRPYQCEFGVWRDGDPDVVSMRLALEPKIVDLVTAGAEHRLLDGADVYLDKTFCSATVFVGPPLQRRMPGGEFVDVANVVVRPAVVVDSGTGDCEPVVDVAGTAARLFG